MAAIVIYLVLLAVSCTFLTIQGDQLKCPSVMPYAGCTCYENHFQVRCNSSANFTESSMLPDMLPDSLMLTIDGLDIEVLDVVPYPNLMTLSLGNNNLRLIHDGAFKQLTNLETLVLSNNPLGEITRETLMGLNRVNFINMENSRIYKIPAYTFIGKYLSELGILRLGNASIYDIGPHAFHMLNRLALLNISQNYLHRIPEFASSDGLRNLTTLDLSFNQIRALNPGELASLVKLQFLLLNNNRITQIGSHSFHGLMNIIVSIDLSHNEINYTDPTAFISLSKMQSLYLNSNKLSGLVWEELPWDNLVNLVLHHNPWNCACHNSWLIESELIAIHNNNTQFTCGSPASVAGQQILAIPESTFACPQRTHRSHTKALLLGVGAAISLLAAAIGALLLCRCIRKKKKRSDLGVGSTPTSAYKRVKEDQGELILRT